jgi:uncharacterized metal-binding protein
MTDDCGCRSVGETLVFTCAGAAHSGQVTNRAGIRLMQEGTANLLCVASIGAEIPDKMERTRSAARRVVLDGCEEHCARKVMEKAELPVDLHLDVTRIGIEKQPETPSLINDTKQVVAYVNDALVKP